MTICVLIGWYAWREDMNMSWICYWGITCLFQGVFDMAKVIDLKVHTKLPFWSPLYSGKHNFESGCVVAVPISLLLGAIFAFMLYKKRNDFEPLLSEATHGRR